MCQYFSKTEHPGSQAMKQATTRKSLKQWKVGLPGTLSKPKRQMKKNTP